MGNIQQFLSYLLYEKHYSALTIRAYANDLEQCHQFLVALNTYIDQATSADLRAWVVSLLEQNISAASVQRKISTLKAYFKYLQRQKIISSDPTRKLISPKKQSRLPVYVEEKNIVELFEKVTFDETFEDQRNKIVLSLLFGTGIRLSELINLKISDIDFASQTIKVLGKRKKERIIPFGTIIKNDILHYLKYRKPPSDTPYLILNNHYKQSYPKLIYRIVHHYLSLITSIDKKKSTRTAPHICYYLA